MHQKRYSLELKWRQPRDFARTEEYIVGLYLYGYI